MQKNFISWNYQTMKQIEIAKILGVGVGRVQRFLAELRINEAVTARPYPKDNPKTHPQEFHSVHGLSASEMEIYNTL